MHKTNPSRIKELLENKEKNFNPCSLNPKTVAPNTTVKLSENVKIK
jgi:hypothetical protein